MSTNENLTSAEIIKRFNHFYDCWLDSITVTYAKGTAVRLRFCAVDWNHVDGGWEKAATDDVWRYVTVTLEDISDYRVQGPFISICSGVHALERDGKIGLDVEGYNDNPETFEDIAEADIYFIAENATWELGPLGVHCGEGGHVSHYTGNMTSSVMLLNSENPQGVAVDPTQPLIGVEDQGFTRGDGVFETMLAVDRRVRKLDMHLARLESSARMLDLPEPDLHQLQDALANLLAQAVPGAHTEIGEEHIVKIIISRGLPNASAGMPTGPYTLLIASPVPETTVNQRQNGVKAMLLPRGHDPADNTAYPWLLAGAKTLSYAVNMAVLRYVHSRGADDAIFMTDNRRILEGATSSVLMARIENGVKTLYTPEPNHGILPGTTQGAIFEAARRDGWELGYGPLYPQDLFESDGVWLASSVRLLAPVTHLNGTALAHDAQLTHRFLEYLAQG